MLPEIEDAAIHSDAYIDALLAGHARRPIALASGAALPVPSMRQLIRLLERGVPRFSPSFLFEERLAQQLRAVAEGGVAAPVLFDRRLLFGGAIASGFSIAGAAMWAWRRRQ